MRTVFEEEEQEIDDLPRDPHPHSGPDRELTISSTTLLTIFFGLVLLCGLFFGLGYSLGRRSPADTSQLPAAALPAQAASSQSKPSAAAQTTVATPAVPQPEETVTSTPQDDAVSPEPEAKANMPAPQPVKLDKPAPKVQSGIFSTPAAAIPAPQPETQPATQSGALMVQIAAVSNPADADVLVRALEKHGYSVTSRRVAGDAFIHVQVGPFGNRADAVAMRQKLLADGYNAILK